MSSQQYRIRIFFYLPKNKAPPAAGVGDSVRRPVRTSSEDIGHRSPSSAYQIQLPSTCCKTHIANRQSSAPKNRYSHGTPKTSRTTTPIFILGIINQQTHISVVRFQPNQNSTKKRNQDDKLSSLSSTLPEHRLCHTPIISS